VCQRAVASRGVAVAFGGGGVKERSGGEPIPKLAGPKLPSSSADTAAGGKNVVCPTKAERPSSEVTELAKESRGCTGGRLALRARATATRRSASALVRVRRCHTEDTVAP